jgi:hypothetical protein
VYASLILATAQAALVTVAPGPSDNCPSSAQVLAALEFHAPALVTPGQNRDSASQTTLVLSPALATGDFTFFLLDRSGRVKLNRTLPPPDGDRGRDCAALADTVALIVDRYYNEVELPPLPEKSAKPEPMPSAPQEVAHAPEPNRQVEAGRYALSLGIGRRMPGSAADLGGNEISLIGGMAVAGFGGHGGRLWLETSAGIVGIVYWAWPQGNVTAVRTAWGLSALLAWPAWRGRLYAGALTSVEYLWLDATSNSHLQHETRLAPSAGLRGGYLLFLREHVFIRMDLGGSVAIVRYDLATQSHSSMLLSAPRVYATAAIGVGISF